MDFKLPALSGTEMFEFMKKLFPLCRSITGNGTRETLKHIKKIIPLQIKEIASGTRVFDWTIPEEWNVTDAYIKNSQGQKIVDFKASNIHLMGYSVPIYSYMSLEELKKNLITLPEHPQWIPYATSYYKKDWKFCITYKQYQELPEDLYEVYVGTSLRKGYLSYGELYLKGQSQEEVLLSTYLCHPSLCNDNLSGLVVLTFLARALINKKLRYSYRFLFIPETIGAIAWLSQNKNQVHLIKHGLVATCLGDPGNMTYKRSRRGNEEIDQAVEKMLKDSGEEFEIMNFYPWGSDERQFCSPGFNLPVGSLMRTPYGSFPEYHTSADNLDYVKGEFLSDSLNKYLRVLFILENNRRFLNTNPMGEPHLGNRGFFHGARGGSGEKIILKGVFWVLNYSDGTNSLLDISYLSGMKFEEIKRSAEILFSKGLLKLAN